MVKWQAHCQDFKRIIEKVESGSAIELVILLQQPCGIGQVFFKLLAVVSVVWMAVFLVYSPWDFSDQFIIPMLLLSYGVGPLCQYLFPNLPLRWIDRKIIRATLLNQARVHWMERGMSNTRARTSALLMLSPQEKEATWIFDLGVERAVPIAEILRATDSWKSRDTESFLRAAKEGLQALAPLLSEKLPREEDDTNELADEVYIVAPPAL